MKDEKEIAKDIKALAEKYAGENNDETEIADLKSTIDYMVNVVFSQLYNGKSLAEDAKTNGLTLNQLEAEGFVRACLTIKNEFSQWNDILSVVVKRQEEEAQQLLQPGIAEAQEE